MLKLNYTEVGLYMEQVMASPEMLIAQRVILAMRLGQILYVEPGRASFLVPADACELAHLAELLRWECNKTVCVSPIDAEFAEISLSGSWIAESVGAQEGMFLTMVSDSLAESIRERAESLVYKLWQLSQVQVSSLA